VGGVAEVTNSILIEGPIHDVFDLVATTTRGRSGTRRAVIGGREHEDTWTVTEHRRPAKLVLQIDAGRIQITYRFGDDPRGHPHTGIALSAAGLRGRRRRPHGLEQRMRTQSQTALERLKPLVERTLSRP